MATVRLVDGQTRLVAHVVLRAGARNVDEASLRAFVAERAPGAVFPSAVAFVDALPRPSLDGNSAQARSPGFPSAQFAAPETARETSLCNIFSEILKISPVSVNDDFFDLGGHSLLGARLISRLSADTKMKIPLRTIFEHRTPRKLARFVDDLLPVDRMMAAKPMLILFPGGGVMSREVINLQNVLVADFAVQMIDYPDWRCQGGDFFDFEKYLANILSQITQAAPAPCPLRLAGYSFGSGIAYAMAVMLGKLGYQIELLAMIDGRSPVLIETPAPAPEGSVPARVFGFLRRDRVLRNRQIGRYVGMRAKNSVVRKLLQWTGPLLPMDQTSELVFYLTAFINAAVPMHALREWTRRLALSDRCLNVPNVLFRSKDNGDNWPMDLGWKELLPTLEVMSLPGTHITVLGEANLEAMRARIAGLPAKSGAGPAAVNVNERALERVSA